MRISITYGAIAMTKASSYPKPPFPEQNTGAPPGVEEQMSPRPEYRAPTYRAAGKLDGLAAIITGGDSGIGRSVAVLFAREGANVAFTHLPEERIDADKTMKAIGTAGVEGLAMEVDVRDPDQCRLVVEQVVKKFG